MEYTPRTKNYRRSLRSRLQQVVTTDEQFAEIAEKIKNAETLIFTAGAGMGVDSGLPDFRGNNGFWKAYPALRGRNISFSDMACPDWFDKNPAMAWGFYGHRLNLYRETTPHAGFDLLLKWSEGKEYFCYTSNVDGSYQKAGFDPLRVVECHGSIHHLQPMNGGSRDFTWLIKDDACWDDIKDFIYDDETELMPQSIVSADPFEVTINEEELLAEGELPRDADGSLLRPNILMFGDWGWDSSRTDEQYDRFAEFLKGQRASKVVVIEIGAGKVIPSVRSKGNALADLGATLVRINPRDFDGAEYGIPMGGLEALKRIEAMM